ncbi:hypothetical protein [Mycobacterium sp. UM_CSW]|uniref:hypothetical protein n=1 Tax=Mycobacterium sp. UM_CSW TaxID=1370119 RepID=UPI0012691B61|nr:hypothetical protein [Mycobacterium sp. UM_CSW]
MTTQRWAISKPQVVAPAMMDIVGTAVVVAIVAVLMLLGIGMVVNQLFRLRKWLNAPPPDQPPGDQTSRPPE